MQRSVFVIIVCVAVLGNVCVSKRVPLTSVPSGISAGNCTYTSPSTGRTYDLSSLINPNGGYNWTQTYSNKKLQFFLQVCANVENVISPCNTLAAAPAYVLDPVGKCSYPGQLDLNFSDNPSGDGVNLTYQNGQSGAVTVIYFNCGTTGFPSFEHITNDNQYHYKFFTKLVC